MPVKVSVAERKKSVTCPVRRATWSVPSEGGGTETLGGGGLLLPHHQSTPTSISRASTGSTQRRAALPATVAWAELVVSDTAVRSAWHTEPAVSGAQSVS